MRYAILLLVLLLTAPAAAQEELTVNAGDYAIALGATAGMLIYERTVVTPRIGSFGELPVDKQVRSLLRLRSDSARSVAWKVSDVGFYGVTVHTLIVDPVIQSSWELAVIQMQVIGVSSFMIRPLQRSGWRTRPNQMECNKNPNYSSRCPERAESLISGHATVAFAGATSMCVIHDELNIKGPTCAVGLSAATVTALARVMGDVHWFSDVVVGSALGAAVGYLIPTTLHFTDTKIPYVGQVLPFATPYSIGVRYVVRF